MSVGALPKVVYFGSDAICLPGLEYLRSQAGDVCELSAVISQPDRPQGRGKRLQANPVAAWANEHGVELFQPEKPGRELANWFISEEISIAFVMAYGHFLGKALREAPQYGMVNFHGSLLPAYRGASPVETAVAEGEIETGVCLMRIDKEMDAGGVSDRESVSIDPLDTASLVREKIGNAVVPLLARNVLKSVTGELRFTEQIHENATFCRKISKADGAIDFEQSAQSICNRLRAFNPWPGAYFDFKGERIKVGEMSEVDSVEHSLEVAAGTVVGNEGGLLVATSDGVISMETLQRAGGRFLKASDFLRGFPIASGEVLLGAQNIPLVRKET